MLSMGRECVFRSVILSESRQILIICDICVVVQLGRGFRCRENANANYDDSTKTIKFRFST